MTAAYIGAFHWSYTESISPVWGYSGLVYQPALDGSLIVAVLLAWLPAGAMPVRATRPSVVVLWIIFGTVYIPAVIMPYYVLGAGWDLSPLTVALVIGMGLLLAMHRIPIRPIGSPVTISPTSYLWVQAALALVLTSYVVSVFGLTFALPDFASVYDRRAQYVEALTQRGATAAYAIGWCAGAIAPLLVVLGITSRRRLPLTVLGAAILLFIYGVTGFKSALLIGPVLFILVVLLRSSPSNFGVLVPAGLSALILLAVAFDSFLTSTTATSIAVNRFLNVPGQLTAYYYEFFDTHPTYSLSHSVLRAFVEQPYPVTPPDLIGHLYFQEGVSANANFWADGIANFGLIGLFLATLATGAILILFDRVSVGRSVVVCGSLLGAASLALTNSGVLTSLLTHGLGLAAVMVWLMPPQVDRHDRQHLSPKGDRSSRDATQLAPS